MIRPVVRLPAAVLTHPSVEIDPQSDDAMRLAVDLVDTMRASLACVGLAAPQIGEPSRVFCMDVSGHKKARTSHGLVVLANPEIVSASSPEIGREGCMSVPDFTANVARATRVVVRGREPGTGALVVVDAEAFEARAVLHEVDHLNGVVFLDRVASARHDVFPRKRYT